MAQVTITYVRNHTSGTLKGMSTEGSLDFPNEGSARDWLRGVRKYEKRNGWSLGCFTLNRY